MSQYNTGCDLWWESDMDQTLLADKEFMQTDQMYASSASRAAASRWVHNAFKAATGAFGTQLEWARESPEIAKAQDALDFYLGAYFYSTTEGGPTVTMEQVTDAWRVYWKAHLIGQQELI